MVLINTPLQLTVFKKKNAISIKTPDLYLFESHFTRLTPRHFSNITLFNASKSDLIIYLKVFKTQKIL